MDGGGVTRDVHPVLSVQFFYIDMQFWGKIGQNNTLAPSPFRLPSIWEILDPPLHMEIFLVIRMSLGPEGGLPLGPGGVYHTPLDKPLGHINTPRTHTPLDTPFHPHTVLTE